MIEAKFGIDLAESQRIARELLDEWKLQCKNGDDESEFLLIEFMERMEVDKEKVEETQEKIARILSTPD